MLLQLMYAVSMGNRWRAANTLSNVLAGPPASAAAVLDVDLASASTPIGAVAPMLLRLVTEPTWPLPPEHEEMYETQASRGDPAKLAMQRAAEAEANWLVRSECAWALANLARVGAAARWALREADGVGSLADAVSMAAGDSCGWVDELVDAAPRHESGEAGEPVERASFAALPPLLACLAALLEGDDPLELEEESPSPRKLRSYGSFGSPSPVKRRCVPRSRCGVCAVNVLLIGRKPPWAARVRSSAGGLRARWRPCPCRRPGRAAPCPSARRGGARRARRGPHPFVADQQYAPHAHAAARAHIAIWSTHLPAPAPCRRPGLSAASPWRQRAPFSWGQAVGAARVPHPANQGVFVPRPQYALSPQSVARRVLLIRAQNAPGRCRRPAR